MQNIKIEVGDLVIMKKKHPCSANTFKILRIGSDIRFICTGCGRDLTLPREKLEKMIKRILPGEADKI